MLNAPLIKRTTIVVRDVERSRAFYCDVLGFKAYYDKEFVFAGLFPGTRKGDKSHLLIVESGPHPWCKIGLLQYTDPLLPDAPVPSKMDLNGVVFVGEVDDVQELDARLRAAGYPVQAPPHDFEVMLPDGTLRRRRRVCFFDPDGVFFELTSAALVPSTNA